MYVSYLLLVVTIVWVILGHENKNVRNETGESINCLFYLLVDGYNLQMNKMIDMDFHFRWFLQSRTIVYIRWKQKHFVTLTLAYNMVYGRATPTF